MPRPRRGPGPPAPTASSSSQLQQPPSRSSTDFEICVYDCPRYRPGQTPPQPPISLLPVHDTDAFIVGKLVTPFGVDDDLADDDDDDDSDLEFEELRRRALQKLVAASTAADPAALRKQQQQQTVRRVLNYVVGWPDVPYARELVPCTEVLDYVSPRTLEDWEYAATLRQHAAAAAAAAQKKGHKAHKPADGETAAESADGHTAGHPPNGPQRKRRRARRKLLGPSKKRKTAAPPAATEAPPTPAAAAATASAEAEIPAPLYTQAHSATTTPRASKVFGANAAAESIYASASPTAAWLHRTADGENRPGSSSTVMGMTEAAAAAAATMASPASDRQQLLAQSIPSLVSGKQRTGLSLTQPYRPTTSTSADGKPDSLAAANVAIDADADELIGDHWMKNSNRANGIAAGDGAGDDMYFADAAPMSTANGTEDDDDDDGPEDEDDDDNDMEDSENQQQDQLSSRVTYIPPPALPYHFSPSKHRDASVASLAAVPQQESPRSKRENEHDAAAQALIEDEMDVDGEDEENAYAEDATEDEEEEEDLYEVDCIEDHYLMKADEAGDQEDHKRSRVDRGQDRGASPDPVHFFLVRWKGDWPPDQNPTWERAENLPPDMVRQYLKKVARKKAKGGSNRNDSG